MVHFYSRLFVFIFGAVLGAFIGFKYRNDDKSYTLNKQILSYNKWFEAQGYRRKMMSWDIIRYSKKKYIIESNILFHKIKVLCIILVQTKSNIDAIRNTWAKNCNNLESVEIKTRKDNLVAIKRSKESASWVLLCQLLQSTSTNYDWFLIINDNMFAILENLRYYVAVLNSSDNYYLGHATKFWNTVYNSGQAGYVISRGTLKNLQQVLNNSGCIMNSYWNREDFYLGQYIIVIN